ncbi:hypothetical protein [Streptomyces sp. NPDC085466]|uniref:hypothetical protein n=1 Tax=Streptomyces sp. NPDC085466 TaxID=3365725 RepID=UPI0037CEF433
MARADRSYPSLVAQPPESTLIREEPGSGVHVHNPEDGAEAQAEAHEMAELLFKYVIPHREALIPLMTHEDMLEFGRLETIFAVGAHRRRPNKD